MPKGLDDMFLTILDRYGLWAFLLVIAALVVREAARSFLPPLGQVIIKEYEARIAVLRETEKAMAQVPVAIAAFKDAVDASEQRTRGDLAAVKNELHTKMDAALDSAVDEIKTAIADNRYDRLETKVERAVRLGSSPNLDPLPEQSSGLGHQKAPASRRDATM
jgi:hypothetical protein